MEAYYIAKDLEFVYEKGEKAKVLKNNTYCEDLDLNLILNNHLYGPDGSCRYADPRKRVI